MLKRFALLLVSCTCIASAFCQDFNQIKKRAEAIKAQQDIYKYGEGIAITEEEADLKALNELASTIRVTVIASTKVKELQENNNYSISFSDESKLFSAASFKNAEQLSYKQGNNWVVTRYVRIKDLEQAKIEREDKIRDYVYQGIEQEKQLNIAGALQYYNWALNLAVCYKDDIEVEVEGKKQNVILWLPLKIRSIFNNVAVEIDNNRIEYDPNEYDKYTVNLTVKYAGNPVSNIDLSYFNGESQPTLHVKSGEAALKFIDLPGSETGVKVLYNYADEACLFDDDLRAAYEAMTPVSFKDANYISVPLKIKKSEVKLGSKDKKEEPADLKAAAGEVMPMVGKEKATIERNFASDATCYIATMQQVENAIRAKKYDNVKHLFTTEGFSIFMMMMNNGKVTVNQHPDFTVETSGLYIIGKKIPVTVKVGKHASNENIVFRFDKESGKIKSVAYALTQRAENDIFRKASWNLESRYSILTFMEDYQTAFALQRLDYIKSIFSNDAVIITGKVAKSDQTNASRFIDFGNLPSNKKINYRHYTKNEYLQSLKRDFHNKRYINITFEDTEISKVDTEGYVEGHEVLWIELKQHYTSDSYSDIGFLTLQVNMKSESGLINVRTWTPEFIPLDEMKKRFPIRLDFNN